MASLHSGRHLSWPMCRSNDLIVAVERCRNVGSIELFWEQAHPGGIGLGINTLVVTCGGWISADVRLQLRVAQHVQSSINDSGCRRYSAARRRIALHALAAMAQE